MSLNKTPTTTLKGDDIQFYSEWHHSVVRALLDVCNIEDDFSVLSKSITPSVSYNKVNDSMLLLSRLGMIKKNEQGFWKQTNKNIELKPYQKNEIVKLYQLKKIELGQKAVLSKTKKLKRTSTQTISVSKKMLEKIDSKILKLHSEIRSMCHKDTDPAEMVYQINLQLFPQTK